MALRDIPEDFVPGPSSADALNKLPRGNFLHSERYSNVSDIDGVEAVLSVDFTIPEGGRRQRFTCAVTLRSGTAGGVQARIEVDGTQVQRRNDTIVGAGKDVSFSFPIDVELDAGDHTVELIVGREGAGSNLVTCLANGRDDTSGATTLYGDDVGPAYVF